LLSGDVERAEGAVPELRALGDNAVERLLSLLEVENPDHRWWAVRALAAFEQPAALRGLVRALADRHHAAVRHCAAIGLREHPTPEALPLLISALHDEDRFLARLAADALAALGVRAIPELHKASQSATPAVRIEAVRALARMQEPETIAALFSAIDDPSSIVTHWAEQGLEDLGIGMVFFEP
jgi:HEAT repeat protein